MTDFGKAIQILRLENNRKQKQDAEDFGATASYISAIENGKKQVSDSYLEYCIKTYGDKDRLTELAEKQNQSTEKIAVIRCRDCKFATITNGVYGREPEVKYCDIWFPTEAEYMPVNYYCASAERKEE